MIYISPENEYPRHIGDIQLDFPSFKEGDAMPIGWNQVFESPRPETGADQVAYEGLPQDVKGVITQTWIVRDLTQAELDRRNAPEDARARLTELGFTDAEIQALVSGLVR